VPRVSKTYRLDQLASAYEVLAGGHAARETRHRSLMTDQLVHPWSEAAASPMRRPLDQQTCWRGRPARTT